MIESSIFYEGSINIPTYENKNIDRVYFERFVFWNFLTNYKFCSLHKNGILRK